MKFKWLDWIKKKLASLRREDPLDEIPEVEDARRSEVDISNPDMRRHYVQNLCDVMLEATREIDYATREYRLVTDYLKDMDEMDALPDGVYRPLKAAAKSVLRLENDRQVHTENTGRMSEDQYEAMEAIARDMPDALDQIKKNEEYKFKVRDDLQKLEGEKGSYAFQRREMALKMASCRNMAVITVISFVFVMLMLLAMQFLFRMNVMVGTVIAGLATAVALTWIYLEYADAKKGLKRAVNFLNQVIAKQNTVKIRYVNVENLLAYQYQKYHVMSSDELQYLWDLYLGEKEERRLANEAGAELTRAEEELLRALKAARLQYPAIWLHQCYAIIDRREMVELRHDLVARRGSLRKRIQYNTDNRQRARDEVNDLVKKYPNYAREIIEIVSTYE
ncbi:MAG: hypothetical protein K6F35_01750 [Lachnospiraceae bacterium]|nr:hypothetical protein [Lachnospiraceae bacterium]